MTTIAEWSDLMGSILVVKNPTTGVGGPFGGQPLSTGGGTEYAMHWQQGKVSRRYTEGLTDEATGMAWVASTSTSAIRRESKFSLPDGAGLVCLRVVYERDADGTVHHTVVVFG